MHQTSNNNSTRIWLVSASVAVLVLLGVIAVNSNLKISGVEGRLIENGQFSEAGLQAVVDATSSESATEAFLDKNPALPGYLATQIQALKTKDEYDSREAVYFSRISSSLRHLLESSARTSVRQSLEKSDGGAKALIHYLDEFTANQKIVGEGYVSNLDEANQQATEQAIKLIASLHQVRDIRLELEKVASWYAQERNGRTQSASHQEWLLQYAWELSLIEFNYELNDLQQGIQTSLKKDTDLARILNHVDQTVVNNAANLITFFVPENAITSLRFQLVRSDNNQERFLLLNAIKLYGEQRSQIEPQLKKMLRLTRETELQKKILETINHLNGRLDGLSLPS